MAPALQNLRAYRAYIDHPYKCGSTIQSSNLRQDIEAERAAHEPGLIDLDELGCGGAELVEATRGLD